MSGGLSLQQFVDWSRNTGPQFLSGDRNIINAVSRRSFLLGKFLRDKSASKVLRGSNKIQETIYLNANRTFTNFKRNEDVSWQNPQKDVVMDYDWRYSLDHMSWDEAEYLQQSADAGPDGLKTKYKDMDHSKKQRLWESMIDGMEGKLWQAPNGATQFAEMEGDNGGEQYSVPVFVNENAGGATGSFDATWTTVGGISWATYSANWDNKRVQYDAADPEDSDGDSDGLFDAFDDISIETGYETPGFKDQYFEKDSSYGGERTSGSRIIATSKNGKKQIMRLHRNSNDSLITPQDAAYPMPRWNGIPIKDVSALDTAALYDDGSSGFAAEGTSSSSSATNGGPRYYFLDCDNLFSVFHRAKYFKMNKVKEPERKVGVFVIPVECWWNLVCTNRRTQGIVYPGA